MEVGYGIEETVASYRSGGRYRGSGRRMAIIRQPRRGKSGQGQYGEYGFKAEAKSNSPEQECNNRSRKLKTTDTSGA
jgi:hypothetical protein